MSMYKFPKRLDKLRILISNDGKIHPNHTRLQSMIYGGEEE